MDWLHVLLSLGSCPQVVAVAVWGREGRASRRADAQRAGMRAAVHCAQRTARASSHIFMPPLQNPEWPCLPGMGMCGMWGVGAGVIGIEAPQPPGPSWGRMAAPGPAAGHARGKIALWSIDGEYPGT